MEVCSVKQKMVSMVDLRAQTTYDALVSESHRKKTRIASAVASTRDTSRSTMVERESASSATQLRPYTRFTQPP